LPNTILINSRTLNISLMVFPKSSRYPSIGQFKILLLIHKNKTLNYKEQEIYRKERSFERAMLCLIKAGWIRKRKDKNFYDNYSLRLEGLFVVEDVLKPYIKNNRK